MFVNTLALRAFPSGGKTFREFWREVSADTLGAIENQDYPFQDLVRKLCLKRDLSRNPLFDVLFVMQNTGGRPPETGLFRYRPVDFTNKIAKFDLTLNTYETGAEIRFELEFGTALFRKETIVRMARHYLKIT